VPPAPPISLGGISNRSSQPHHSRSSSQGVDGTGWLVYTTSQGPLAPGSWALLGLFQPDLPQWQQHAAVFKTSAGDTSRSAHVVHASPCMAMDMLHAASASLVTAAADVVRAASAHGPEPLPPATLHTVSKRCSRHTSAFSAGMHRCTACRHGTFMAQPCKWKPSASPGSSRLKQHLSSTPEEAAVPALLVHFIPGAPPEGPVNAIGRTISLPSQTPNQSAPVSAVQPTTPHSRPTVVPGRVALPITAPDTRLAVAPGQGAAYATPGLDPAVQLQQALSLLDATPVILTLVRSTAQRSLQCCILHGQSCRTWSSETVTRNAHAFS
jgi:hypothetical protein